MAVLGTTALVLGLSAMPLHAQCTSDSQGNDDEPGQKDLSQYCIFGSCGGSSTSIAWSWDNTDWSGGNSGDACALFDTDGDGFANRALCVTITGTSTISADSPRCFTCNDTREDRCAGSAQVACSSTCQVTLAADPFTLDADHVGNVCSSTSGCPLSATCCRSKDAQATCCIASSDTGGGVLIDVCSIPSQQPGSDPSDCVVARECSKQDPNDPRCDDNNPCTVDSCDTSFGVCHHVAGNSGTVCRTSTGPCDAAETCNGTSTSCPPDQFSSGNVCRAANGLCDVAETCTGNSADCPPDGFSSGNQCRASTGVCDAAEFCDGSSADCPQDVGAPSSTPCNDGSACTTGDHCNGSGQCVGGSPVTCNDNNPCTDDSCDPATGCTTVNNSAPCNDNNACTSNDVCSGGACGGTTINCNDQNPCTDDTCNTSTGCVNTPNSNACNDNDPCTSGDQCQNSQCVGGGATDCDDGNVCTTDGCDSGTADGCTHDGIGGCCNFDSQCADTDACTANERCVNHACTSDPVVCDDGDPCTDDRCDPVLGCQTSNNSNPCDDNNACTANDTCTEGSCVGTPISCVDDNPCTDDTCNPSTGCVNTANTEPCNDNNPCTTNDTCSATQCVGGPPPNCADTNPCTDDTCDPAGGGCVHPPNTAPCNDGDPCTLGDTCSDGSCQPGGAKDCNDLNPCTTNTCNHTTGSCEGVFNTDQCDDNDPCTVEDTCSLGECHGTQKDCNDSLNCTIDLCVMGTCTHPPVEDEHCCDTDEQCADTDRCTINERCVANHCVSDSVDCTDPDPCTIDFCDSEGGGMACQHTPCTDPDTCPATCLPGPECGDGIVQAPETCDPPGSNPVPGVVCRADCTFCGDGVTQTTDGEVCDDGNKVEGCPRNRPLDDCGNTCQPPICRDPSKATLSTAIDKFNFHGRLVANSTVDFRSGHFSVELTDGKGHVIFRTSAPANRIVSVSGTPNGPFKYSNKTAKIVGGLAKMKAKKVGDTYRTTVQGYGNLLGVQNDMIANVQAGKQKWTIHGDWEQRGPRVWRFVEP